MATATNCKKETITDLTELQVFLADRRLAPDNQIPHFVRWVRPYLFPAPNRMVPGTNVAGAPVPRAVRQHHAPAQFP